LSDDSNNKSYPSSNLSDTQYRTTYAFKENQNIEISLKLDLNSSRHLTMTDLSVDKVLKPNDTLLKPFKLSLVNGYVKSEKTFKQNGRVKTMDIFLNNNYKGTVQLLDTPIAQEFEIDIVFFKNDVIKLIPKSYYTGTKYDDICISEIQTNLGAITHSSLNEKYEVSKIRNKTNLK